MSSKTADAPQRRLLWIHQNYVDASQSGNSRPIHIISALLEQGWTVHVVTTQSGYLEDENQQGQTRQQEVVIQQEGNLTVHRLRQAGGLHSRARSYVAFLAKALRYVGRVGDVDMIYASTPPLPQVLLAILVSIWKRTPMILEVRDLWPAFLVELKMLRFTPWIMIFEWIEALAYRYADHCISVSPGFSGYLTAFGVPEGRMSVAPTGGNPCYREIEPAKAAAWRKQHGLDGKLVVLYAGSFQAHYGLATILEAAQRIAPRRPEIAWVFAGNGRLRQQVETAAAETDCVQYLGNIPKEELMPAYPAADLGVVSLVDTPMLNTVMPGKLFDYLAAGVPSLVVNTALAGALVETARAGRFVPNATTERLVEALMEITALPRQELKAMGTRGQQWILKNINAADMAQKVAADVTAVFANQRRGSRFLRMLSAASLACADTLTRRSARIVRRLVQDDLERNVRESLHAWLEEQL